MVKDMCYDHVVQGCVWSGDAYASTRAASMMPGVVCLNGVYLSVAAVTARTFTASTDTYIDLYDAGNGTAGIQYTETTNNAATGSPVLTPGSIRIGIIITGAGNIADVGSVNQGQAGKVLPVVSSIAYSVSDSLGNRICNRSPSKQLLSLRKQTANFGTTSATHAQVPSLSVVAQVNAGDTLRVVFHCGSWQAGGLTSMEAKIWDGAVITGTQLDFSSHTQTTSTYNGHIRCEAIVDITSSGTKTFNISGASTTASGATLIGNSTAPMYVSIERIQ